MPDITDPDSLATRPDPPPRKAAGVTRPLIIDCRGPAGVSADQQAPVCAILSGHPDLTLYPGVQPVDSATWTAYLRGHNGVTNRASPPKDKDGNAPAPQVVVLDGLPRRAAELTELVDRTWSTAGLDMLAAREGELRPKGSRRAVTVALTAQRRRLARRVKTPKT